MRELIEELNIPEPIDPKEVAEPLGLGELEPVIVRLLCEEDEVVGRVLSRLLAAKRIGDSTVIPWKTLRTEKVEHLNNCRTNRTSSPRAKNQEEESEGYDQISVFRSCLSVKPETTGAALEMMEPRYHGNESGTQISVASRPSSKTERETQPIPERRALTRIGQVNLSPLRWEVSSEKLPKSGTRQLSATGRSLAAQLAPISTTGSSNGAAVARGPSLPTGPSRSSWAVW
jgi:hypothetical protein